MMMRSSNVAVVMAVLVAMGALADAHKCIHDTFIGNIKHTHTAQDYSDRRRAVGDTYSPIRFSVTYGSFADTTTDKADYVQKTLMPAAIARLNGLLSVLPVTGNLIVKQPCKTLYTSGNLAGKCATVSATFTCGSATVPTSHYTTETCTGQGVCTTTNNGTGVPNTDMVFYVESRATDLCNGGSAIAYAHHCTLDQYDRPVSGYVNFCPSMIETEATRYQSMLSTALHEMTHALGFSGSLFGRWRDENLNPRTARDASKNPINNEAGNTTVKSFTERGYTLQKLVTPAVMKAAKLHFGCDSLNGAELESQGGDGTAGSHWESRIFLDEYMVGADRPGQAFSALSEMTMSALADSGWYKINWTAVEPLVWGRGLGCSFATEKCLSGSPPKANFPFCTDTADDCSYDGTSRGLCNVATYGSNLSAEYQYFSDPKVGGTYDFADFCPFVAAYSNGDCRTTANANTNGVNVFGNTWGANSRCFKSTLIKTGFSGTVPPGCFETECKVGDDGIKYYNVRVNGGSFVRCDSGKTLSFAGFNGVVTCQPVDRVCGIAVLPLGNTAPSSSAAASPAPPPASSAPPAGSSAPPAGSSAPPAGSSAPPAGSSAPPPASSPANNPPPSSSPKSNPPAASSPPPSNPPPSGSPTNGAPSPSPTGPSQRIPSVAVHAASGYVVICDSLCVRTAVPIKSIMPLFTLGDNKVFAGVGNSTSLELFIQDKSTGVYQISTDLGKTFGDFPAQLVSTTRIGQVYTIDFAKNTTIAVGPTGTTLFGTQRGIGPTGGDEMIRWRCDGCSK